MFAAKKGFTLVELLIVITVLGIMASAVLVSLNPAEKIARAQDAQRKAGVAQLAQAAQRYFVQNGYYPKVASSTWITDSLVLTKELNNPPPKVSPGGICDTGYAGYIYGENGYCYLGIDWPSRTNDGQDAFIHAQLQSKFEKDKCIGRTPFYLWSSQDGGIGVVCDDGPRRLGGYTYLP